ncbi:MAG: sulfite exporter TauE/SafE family protein [Gemmatimonadetes bacterium]|nr:sulfite exporter TauE/SafE family protein [Gemmatimonadota bacterium]
MPDAITTPLLLFLVGFVAGVLNAIAGGGSLLTLPVMIFLGLPPTVANGTNRVAILVQNVGASWSFHRKGLISKNWLVLAVPPALLGVVLGTLGAIRVGDLAFQRILAVVLVGAAAWTVWRPIKPPAEGDAVPPTGGRRWLFALFFFFVGAYGGFIQAGVGFIVLAVTTAGGLNLVRGNAVKIPLILAFTAVALALFAWSGKVDWAMGLSLAGGNLLGALLGVRLQVLKGHEWVRNVVTVTIVLFAVRLLLSG